MFYCLHGANFISKCLSVLIKEICLLVLRCLVELRCGGTNQRLKVSKAQTIVLMFCCVLFCTLFGPRAQTKGQIHKGLPGFYARKSMQIVETLISYLTRSDLPLNSYKLHSGDYFLCEPRVTRIWLPVRHSGGSFY